MCGFTGFISFNSQGSDFLDRTIKNMNAQLVHRGPDSDGFWCLEQFGLAFGHRRLAIQDLSPAGHQPMVSNCGRYVMVFNGEVYNHLELREHFPDMVWRGHSDTETILACIDTWGFEKTLKQLTGMFAIALWDFELSKLFLARDRLGEKPLFYSNQNGSFIFASELKALKQHPSFNAEIDRDVLCLYMRHNCVPAPYSIYKHTFKLMPGTILTINADLSIAESEYWSATNVVNNGLENRFAGTAQQAVDKLDEVLTTAVNRQVLSDVPLGAFLSGGVDSTSIVALMQANTNKPVKTFTMGFDNKHYNEAEHAKAVANHLGTEHTEMYVSPQEALHCIPELHNVYDEPFADSSQIPTFLVSKLAKQHVTVALSGDGGDELFAGYNRHQLAHTMWPKVNKLPSVPRALLSAGIHGFAPQQLDKLNSFLPKAKKMRQLGDKLHKASAVLRAQNPQDLYLGLISQWKEPNELVLLGQEPNSVITHNSLSDNLTVPEMMMALDMMTYLSDDILTKVDRAAMAVSLETRVPMLDHSVVEFAWSLPLDIKLRHGVTKWPLREVLYKYMPKELIERPKMGFALPLDTWLRTTLREWAEVLIEPIRLQQEGYFNEPMVTKLWQQHLTGKYNHTAPLWCVLMFQQWLENESV
ncbi:asparagine synthase (glutamine-hydrolyzing) [Vibrio diabolicus]|uniref:asparagine synthase (glutamine-hydrolyzing) n=1 Tax=Vibrio diabolicus TaxID=50719 RepID=UPI0024952CD0|nr:asparagine synthase (glutamine-hydrolyzing) [Vibrio diabolicus]